MPFVILNIVAIANLLLLFVLLLSIRPHTKANRLLAAIVLDPIFSMILIVSIYYQKAASYPVLFYISYLYDILWAPFFYFYIHQVLHKEIKITVKNLKYFSLFIFGCIYFAVFALQPEAYRTRVFEQAMTDNYPWQFYLIDYLTIAQVAVYLPSIYNIIKKHNRHIEQVFSNTDQLSAKWIQYMIVLFFFLSAIAYFPSFINAQSIYPFMFFVPLASMLLYFCFVYKVIYSPLVFSEKTLQIMERTQRVGRNKKDENRTLPEDYSTELESLLNALFVEKKLFLDPELNIQALAEKCGTRVHILSAFINKQYKINFFDYINHYRIEEAKQLLADPGQQKYSIETLAMISGFSSRSVFYTAFKKNTGTTPGGFLKTIQATP
ncbi:MAG: AraC family transcriptional regulator [Bacteroidales bacterium]|nr:AraC family transcriptional regulator [Bacteroidales bacterium]